MLRVAVDDFAQEMEKKLAEKDEERGEAGWLSENRETNISFLLDRAKEEFNEAVISFDDCDPESLAGECVDVANFMMMVHDRLRRNHIIKVKP